VYVEGQIRSRQYQDKENVTRYITEIHLETLTMLDPKPATGSGTEASAAAAEPQTYVHEQEPNALPF
jgi:single-strand DNA-binding protein